MICESAGFDFETLRRACNSKWNVEILEARDGIGGHCLPKDIEYLRRTAGSLSSLLSGAVEADRVYREQLKAKGARPSS
jgi:UDP-N-acetyl-D-mannosaminuronate dehydrogenase